jgi:hypothetical protein
MLAVPRCCTNLRKAALEAGAARWMMIDILMYLVYSVCDGSVTWPILMSEMELLFPISLQNIPYVILHLPGHLATENKY